MSDALYHYDSTNDEQRGPVFRVWKTRLGEAKSVKAVVVTYDNEEMARWVTRILGKAAKHEI